MITWNILRAAGIGAYLMLWASVAWGLLSTTSVFGRKISKQTTIALHQAFSTSGLVLLAVHLGFLLADGFMRFTPLDLVVPMRASYRPVGVTLGIAAMFVTILGVLSTSWGRKVIGTKWWRRLHSLSVPAFTLALVHGLMTGTDTVRPAMFWMYVATAASVLFLLVVRALTAGERPQRATLPEGVTRRVPASAGRAAPTADVAPTPGPKPTVEPPPRRRKTPFAPEPIPVIFVQSDLAAAPPGFGLEGPDGDEMLEFEIRHDDGHTHLHGHPGHRHVPSASGQHAAHADVRPPIGAARRGHAPRPHPTTRSPDHRTL